MATAPYPIEGPRRDPVVDRVWLTRQIHDYLEDADSRIIALTGEPGTGKTFHLQSLLEQNVMWLSYFVRKDSRSPLSSGSAAACLIALGHQAAARFPDAFAPQNLEIVVRQRIERAAPASRVVAIDVGDLVASPFRQTALIVDQDIDELEGRLEGIVVRHLAIEPRLLGPEVLGHMALLDPADALHRINAQSRIIVIIDALDEDIDDRLDTSILQWLLSVPRLPANLKFIVSSRPTAAIDNLCLTRKEEVRRIHLSSAIPDVRDDVRELVRKLSSDEGGGSIGTLAGTGEAAFREAVASRAGGNLLYVVALFRSINSAKAAGDREYLHRLFTQAELPDSLSELYASFIMRLRMRVGNQQFVVSDNLFGDETSVEAWPNLYQPLLGLLAVAKEPLNLAQLHRMSCIKTDTAWTGSALERMQHLLAAADGRFRLYHDSLSEFLQSDTTLERWPFAFVGSEEWHRRIAQSCRGKAKKWGDVDWGSSDDYILRYVVKHIAAAGPRGEVIPHLAEVLCEALWNATRDRFATDRVFVDNARMVLSIISSEPTRLSELIRAALVVSHIEGFHYALPAEIVCGMASAGESDKAFASLDLNPDPAERATGYARIAETFLRLGRTDLARSAALAGLQMVPLIQNPETQRYRIQWLTRAGVSLREFDRIERAIREISDRSQRDSALEDYVKALVARRQFRRALRAANRIRSRALRGSRYAELADQISRRTHATAAAATVAGKAAHLLSDTSANRNPQSLVKCAVVMRRNGDPKEASRLFQAALNAAETLPAGPVFGDARSRADALAGVASSIPVLEEWWAIQHIRDLIISFNIWSEKCVILSALMRAEITRGRWDDALKDCSAIIGMMKTECRRERRAEGILRRLRRACTSGDLPVAEKLLSQVEDTPAYYGALRCLSEAMEKAGRESEAEILRKRQIGIPTGSTLSHSLKALAGSPCRIAARARDRSLIRDLLTASRWIVEDSFRGSADARIAFVRGFVRGGAYKAAARVAGHAKEGWLRDEILSELAIELARRGRGIEAVQVVQQLASSDKRAWSATRLWRSFSEQPELRVICRDLIMSEVRKPHDGFRLDSVLSAALEAFKDELGGVGTELAARAKHLGLRDRAQFVGRLGVELALGGQASLARSAIYDTIRAIEAEILTAFSADEIVMLSRAAQALAKCGKIGDAILMARRPELGPLRAETLAGIGARGSGQNGNLAVDEAVEEATNIDDPYLRGLAFSEIAGILMRSDFVGRAAEVLPLLQDAAEAAPDDDDKDDLRLKSAVLLAEAHQFEHAAEEIAAIRSQEKRELAYRGLANANSKAGEFQGLTNAAAKLSGFDVVTTVSDGLAELYRVSGPQSKYEEQLSSIAGAPDQWLDEIRSRAAERRSEGIEQYAGPNLEHEEFAEKLMESLEAMHVIPHFAKAAVAFASLAIACKRGGFHGAASHFFGRCWETMMDCLSNREAFETASLAALRASVVCVPDDDFSARERTLRESIHSRRDQVQTQHMVRGERIRDFRFDFPIDLKYTAQVLETLQDEGRLDVAVKHWRQGFFEAIANTPSSIYQWIAIGIMYVAADGCCDAIERFVADYQDVRSWRFSR